jgi:hypothetical protein
MKEPKKTDVGAAVFFERLPDDGWPEDAASGQPTDAPRLRLSASTSASGV